MRDEHFIGCTPVKGQDQRHRGFSNEYHDSDHRNELTCSLRRCCRSPDALVRCEGRHTRSVSSRSREVAEAGQPRSKNTPPSTGWSAKQCSICRVPTFPGVLTRQATGRGEQVSAVAKTSAAMPDASAHWWRVVKPVLTRCALLVWRWL